MLDKNLIDMCYCIDSLQNDTSNHLDIKLQCDMILDCLKNIERVLDLSGNDCFDEEQLVREVRNKIKLLKRLRE